MDDKMINNTTKKNSESILCIIITYQPDAKIFKKTYQSLINQVDKIIFVDNTPGGSNIVKQSAEEYPSIEAIILGDNLGIGKAQNEGIKLAINLGAKYILLSDQDTEYPDNYIDIMMNAYYSLPNIDSVATIVPDVKDLHNNGQSTGFEVFNGCRSKRVYYDSGCHEVTEGIASGMIIPTPMLQKVGLMNEELFIDWVDNEWFWKAKSAGYKIIACVDVGINHMPGDNPTVSMFTNKKNHNLSSPIRHYYKIRNGISLSLRCPYINKGRKVHLMYNTLRGFAVYVLQGKPRGTHIRHSILGLVHGFINREGKL